MTPDQILSAPQEFDEKAVKLTGYLICEREHCAIYSSSDSLDRANGIWLGNSGFSHKKLSALTRSMVELEGLFHNRRKSGAGHFNRWPAEMTQVTSVERMAEDQSQ